MATRSQSGGSRKRSAGSGGSSSSSRSGSSSSRSSSSRSSSSSRTKRSNGSNGRVAAADVVRNAVEQMAALTGRQIEGVLGLQRHDEGWIVTIEVVELRRVPDSTDVLGSYAVAVDDHGDLQEYRRTRRYYRSQVEED